MKRLISRFVFRPLLFLLNRCIRKGEKNIFFVPHHNCKHDHYDVINYEADNTLCLINYILRNQAFNGYTLYIVHYENDKAQAYRDYCTQVNSQIKCVFLYAPTTDRSILSHLWAFYHCKYAFTSDVYYNFTTKTKKQIVTSLGYFTPFKSDDRHFTDAQFDFMRNYYNQSYSYQITTSRISSFIQCADKGIYWNRHQVLGFPRNDIFSRSNTHPYVKQLEKLTHLTINRIILYTPTYRDYETSESEKHSIFGFPVDAKDMNRLTSILEDHSAILIYKLHPWQEKTCIINSNSIRLLNYRDIPFSCNLYSLMAEADALITDYTSTYFDFLHRDKPVIFNFYDLKEYEEMRGLSYQPVDCIAAGHIITDAHQLIDAISSVLNGQDPYKNKRNEMHRFFNYHHDGNSAERICQQILHNQ